MRKAVLERAGYDVVTAATASAAFHVYPQQDFDGVLLDYVMPEMDGARIAVRLREIRPEVPILLLTALVHLPDAVLEVVDLSMMKAEGPEELIRKTGELVALRQQIRQRESA